MSFALSSVGPAAWRTTRLPSIWWIATLTALAGTFLFFIPVFGMLRTGSAQWPGFMLTGDIRMLWFPQFVSGYHRFWDGSLLGADFFTDGGASVFGLRANLLPLYPPFLLSYLLFDVSNLRRAQTVFTVIYAAHVFVGLFFSVLLGHRFLRLSIGASVLFAAMYALSYQAATYVVFTPFFFQMMLLPALAYALCRSLFTRSFVGPLVASVVVVNYMMTSYGPLMAAGILMAGAICLFVFFDRFFWSKMNWQAMASRLLQPFHACAIALLVALPYYASQALFVAKNSTAPTDLSFVAHLSSFEGRDLVRALSQYILGAPAVEGRLTWGLVAAAILAAGLVVAAYRSDRFPKRSLALFCLGLSLYCVMVLGTLGVRSILSDAIYYTMPLVGSMHLYQRFLMFAQLPFAMAVAIAASFIVTFSSARQRLAILLAGLALWLGVSISVSVIPGVNAFVDIERFLPELFLMFLALIILAIGRSGVAVAALALPAVATMLTPNFDLQRNLGASTVWQTILPPTEQAIGAVRNQFIAEGKILPKVLNVSDAIDSYLPYNLSWMMPATRPYLNYFGYEPHLAMEKDYLTMMGGFYGRFNRQWIIRTGADFVVWDDASRGKLDILAGDDVSIDDPRPLGGGLTVSRLRYVRPQTLGLPTSLLSYSENAPAVWRVQAADGWQLKNGRMVKTAEGTRHHFAIPLTPQPGVQYSVSFDVVESTKGSIRVAFGSKPAANLISGDAPGRKVAIFDVQSIGDLWFSATPDFDGAITNIDVRDIADKTVVKPLSTVFDNGVLRLEASGGDASASGFATNWSTKLSADVKAAGDTRLVYLLWPNRYLVPYLDGKRVAWIRSPGWPAYLDIPAGTHRFELRFESGWVLALKIGTGLYAILLAAALILVAAKRRPFALWKFGRSL